MKALKLRTFSSSSRDNQSNLSTQQDLTYRMIKEVHHLRTHIFNRNTSKRTSLTNHDNVYDNFHMLTLRESLHKNKNYETLLSSPIDLKESHKSSKKVIDHLNGFTFIPQTTRNKTISISKNKTPKTRNQKYSFFNTVDKFKSLSMNSRAEYLTEFVSRTEEISKEKYIHLLQSGNLQRIENPILPILFSKNDLTEINIENKQYYLEKKLIDVSMGNFKSTNTDSCITLFLKWLIFYLYLFNERDYCIDISSEKVVFRYDEINYLNYFNKQNKKCAYCIIDMFDYTYNPGAYLERESTPHLMMKRVMEKTMNQILTGNEKMLQNDSAENNMNN